MICQQHNVAEDVLVMKAALPAAGLSSFFYSAAEVDVETTASLAEWAVTAVASSGYFCFSPAAAVTDLVTVSDVAAKTVLSNHHMFQKGAVNRQLLPFVLLTLFVIHHHNTASVLLLTGS